jgi:nucleoside diphosphate kinase
MVKPDGVNRGLVGDIIARFERKGYKLAGVKVLVPTRELAALHYAGAPRRVACSAQSATLAFPCPCLRPWPCPAPPVDQGA